MTLLVRNEEELIETNILYHLSQGVDFVIATDNRSEDRTPEILERYVRRGYVHLIHEEGRDHSQGHWVTRMARLAATEFGADWVINSDADEFWWPKVGSLKDVFSSIPPAYKQLVAHTRNFLPRPDETGFFADRMVVRDLRSRNLTGDPIEAKIAHRALPDIVVAQGNHAVSGDGDLPLLPLEDLIEVLHFPARSYAQFERKIKEGGQAYEQNKELPWDVGRGRRTAYSTYREGRLPEFYGDMVVDDRGLEKGKASGRLIVDRRLQRFLAARGLPSDGSHEPSLPAEAAVPDPAYQRQISDEISAVLALFAKIFETEGELAYAKEYRDALEKRRDELERQLQTLRNSRLFRYSAPARRVYYRLRGK